MGPSKSAICSIGDRLWFTFQCESRFRSNQVIHSLDRLFSIYINKLNALVSPLSEEWYCFEVSLYGIPGPGCPLVKPVVKQIDIAPSGDQSWDAFSLFFPDTKNPGLPTT